MMPAARSPSGAYGYAAVRLHSSLGNLTPLEARRSLAQPDDFGRACFHLMPVIDHMKVHLRAAERIFVDETRAPVLDPGRKTTKSGYFRAVVSDDRGHGGAGPPIVLFHCAPGRGREHPLKFLA